MKFLSSELPTGYCGRWVSVGRSRQLSPTFPCVVQARNGGVQLPVMAGRVDVPYHVHVCPYRYCPSGCG